MKELLAEIDNLKEQLNRLRYIQGEKVAKAFEMEYTYESNRIEGNTLTLQETVLVIEKGLTISGKSLHEHLEAINHSFALNYIKELVSEKAPLTKHELLNIDKLILQGVDNSNGGKFRTVQVLISGAKHIPPQPFMVDELMEGFFKWYYDNKDSIHPVILAAEIHERLVTIHPFIDGNGRTSRLLMNLILLQHGYPIAILKGDSENRLKYYQVLEIAQMDGDNEPFIEMVALNVKEILLRILQVLNFNI
ncbi:Fic family protein [Dyadobacter frigoris]|uniref:Fic family protein n=1 Tax=Dyadobacter frigoris TaxID=2576211 RepID=A0A4U6DA12_9BACT|nr:Fic family protein [Dyadobacter frigoris]TKT93018.1 Fic family protein [Dyadobacter frigoris]GLU55888.1 cell division protein Fic [Dyadobacter frigoris]